MRKSGISLIVALAAASVMLVAIAALASPVNAEDDWKAEFADICSKTDDPMALSRDEVRKLIERCDKLKPRIEKLADESTRKVYLKRLKMCRDLFAFVLEAPAPTPEGKP